MEKLDTPDFTLAQRWASAIVGIPVVATLLTAFGVYDLSADQQSALQDALQWAGVFAGVLVAGDGVVRHGRATGDTNA